MRILITGAGGRIGKALCERLALIGCEYIPLFRGPSNQQHGICADLRQRNTASASIRDRGPFEVVVHLAALAHNQVLPPGETYSRVNVQILETVLDACLRYDPHFIFASSVAIYGEASHGEDIGLGSTPRPATDYGRSKLLGEKLLLSSPLTDLDILRFTPVYSEHILDDMQKRAQFPYFSRARMWLFPEPRYSFCHLDSCVSAIIALIERGRNGRVLQQIADRKPTAQHHLFKRFSGIPIPVWTLPPLLAARLLYFLPGDGAYALSCNLEKVFATRLFPNEVLKLSGGDASGKD
jgi:nucleoside-diphosphate-sugar epimerase